MRESVRIAGALIAPALAALASVATLASGPVGLGLTFETGGDGYVRISAVAPNSPGDAEGFADGMVVISANDLELVRLPAYVEVAPGLAPIALDVPATEGTRATEMTAPPDGGPTPGMTAAPVNGADPDAGVGPDPATAATGTGSDTGALPGTERSDPEGGPVNTTYMIEPPAPILVPHDPAVVADRLEHVTALLAVREEDLGAYVPSKSILTYVGTDWDGARGGTAWGFAIGGAIMAAALTIAARRRRAGASTALLVATGAATAVPLLLAPFLFVPPASLAWAGAALLALAMLPLSFELALRIPARLDRTIVMVLTSGWAIATCLIVPQQITPSVMYSEALSHGYGIAATIPLLAALGAALFAPELRPGGRLVTSAESVLAGLTPGVALATGGNWIDNRLLLPLSIWLIGLAVAARFTVRPLASLASRAQLQRDVVVAATEAERARVAADIHDDALQELTLLVRRLDAAGDADGAEMARGISDRLRAICGDLRLPLLDDLGVGPALEWLVGRVGRIAGGEVRLERSDSARLPADVELAFFRIAQEALSNATRHGKPPVIVRIWTSEGIASLTVDDAGPGIEPDAGARAEALGHYGLANMAQRAEAIGAILDLRRWPGGGTHVSLEWRSPA